MMQVKRKTLNIFFVFFLCYAQSIFAYSTNNGIIDSAYKNAAIRISSELLQNSVNKLNLNISNSKTKSLLENHLLSISKLNKLIFLAENEPQSPELNILIKETKVDYGWNNSSDSIIRNISVIISSNLNNKSNIIPLSVFEFQLQDTLSEYEAQLANNSISDYAKASYPPKPTNIWQEIGKPILFIAGTALTVYLLFSVRSK